MAAGTGPVTPTLEWARQLGTLEADTSTSVSVDGLGNVYISGYTAGSLEGPNAGGYDAFVSKYSSSGTILWARQIGTSSWDLSYGVSADSLGNVYISGYTEGSLNGANSGNRDAFISKYDSDGSFLWGKQIGTSSNEGSTSVSADGLGNVYISGETDGNLTGSNAGGSDAFVSKYKANGTLEWTRQLGTSSADSSTSVSADGLGNVYISGYTNGDLDGSNVGKNDAFVSKYGDNGILIWTKQFGTSSTDSSLGISSDGLGNVYISGLTYGDLEGTNAGSNDAFISKFNDNGTLLWTEQFGTSDVDISSAVSADSLGNVYISGVASSPSAGANAAIFSAFVNKFDSNGTLLWTEQLEAGEITWGHSVAADGQGNIFISGGTTGNLEGNNAGGFDAFIVKFSEPVPEPGSLLLCVLTSLGLFMKQRTR